MFEQSILAKPKGGRRLLSTCLGVTGEALVVTFVVVAPMVWPQVLPQTKEWIKLYTPTVPRPLGNAPKPAVPHAEPTSHPAILHGFIAPSAVPKIIDTTPDEPVAEPPGVNMGPGGSALGFRDGVPGVNVELSKLLGDRPAPPYHPPEPKPAAVPKEPVPITRIRQGGDVQASKLLSGPKPVYPQMAKIARVQGTVELEAVIGTNGRLTEIRVKSGSPLLIAAAVEAVRQWVYQPTYLNGNPVEVATTIMVTFTLM